MEEQWRTVVYDGVVYDNYEVSNFGRVRSLNYNGERGRIKVLKARDNGTGYLNVVLYKNKKPKRFYVHRLVALMFIENDDPTVKTDVNHKDENKSNNAVDNLEWCDRKYNIHHGTRTKRVSKKLSKRVRCIETGIIYESCHDVERKTGLSYKNISSCCNGKRKTVSGFHWEYVD